MWMAALLLIESIDAASVSLALPSIAHSCDAAWMHASTATRHT